MYALFDRGKHHHADFTDDVFIIIIMMKIFMNAAKFEFNVKALLNTENLKRIIYDIEK